MTSDEAPPCPAWDGRDLGELMDLTPLGPENFRARCYEANDNGRIYGGQMLGQSLAAAARTVPADRPASFLQFLFVAGGLPGQAIDYEVATLQEGKRFSSRHVRGAQPDGRIVCDASASFAKPLAAPAHQVAAPADSGFGRNPDCGFGRDPDCGFGRDLDCGFGRNPERLPGLDGIEGPQVGDIEATLVYAYRPHFAIDVRAPYVEDFLRADARQPRTRFFTRLRRRLGDDAALHAAAFAYLSDYWINFVACLPHVPTAAARRSRLYIASLNHAIWLHRPLRADEWLLFDCLSPSAAGGRGFATARVYDQSGELVASVTQECLLAPAEGG
jgi:acyl-CoA thioesterase-2